MGHSKIQKKMSEENQKKLFIDLFETFLHKDSKEKDKIPVSNKELKKELKNAYDNLKKNQPITQSLSDILEVRRDQKIWDDLNSQYTTFLRNYRQSNVACLLSIL